MNELLHISGRKWTTRDAGY